MIHESVTPLPSAAVAVITALPTDSALRLPSWSTEHILLSDDDHTIFLLVAVSVPTVAISFPVAPTFMNLLFSLNVIVETYSLTTIVQAAVRWHSSVVTSITQLPPFKAVTTPFSSTVATDVSLERYVTFLFSASIGSIEGIIAYFAPTHNSW